MTAPLEGIRVLDLSSVLSGPFTTLLLADMGAEIIKVEPPDAPDFTRGTGNARNGMTAYFYNTNRGKRALAVNGRDKRGQEILWRLMMTADVVVQNMRPGKAAGIGLGPEECLAANPSLVYASISGFGATGPSSGEPVYDYVIQAVTGMVDLQRDPTTGKADLTRHFPADKVTSHAAFEAILGALFARERDPKRQGQHVEVSMHEANLAFFWPDGMMQHSLVGPADQDTVYPGEFYQVYPTVDGAVVLMPSIGPFEGVCRGAGHAEWIHDDRFADLGDHNLLAFQAVLADVIATMTTEQAMNDFGNHDVPVGRVIELDAVHDHPQAVARESVRTYDDPTVGPIRTARPPWRFSATPERLLDGAPTMGRDTVEILTEIGYDRALIDELHQANVVSVGSESTDR